MPPQISMKDEAVEAEAHQRAGPPSARRAQKGRRPPRHGEG
jgi:hypothetical protein